MEVQRRLHDQLEVSCLHQFQKRFVYYTYTLLLSFITTTTSYFEKFTQLLQFQVQHRLQLRIESQGKYLQSILEKACKAINDQAIATAGLEAAREELSELAIKVANDCPPSVTQIDSCLTSNPSPESPMGLSPQAAALKKRQRAMFMQAEWMASNTG